MNGGSQSGEGSRVGYCEGSGSACMTLVFYGFLNAQQTVLVETATVMDWLPAILAILPRIQKGPSQQRWDEDVHLLDIPTTF